MIDQVETEGLAKLIVSVSAVSLNFDLVSSDPDKSRADEIKVLLPKNKKPPKRSKEGKPPGFGIPTGQLESKEDMISALKRETRDETGYPIVTVVGKAFVIYKRWIPNEIHIFVVVNSDYSSGVREREEIDYNIDPWHTLREVFSMPVAQDKNSGSKNPNGIYFSHRKRLYRIIEGMLRYPEDLTDGDAIQKWVAPYRKSLISAMIDLEKAGLLEEFMPQDE